jgi:hypothetical protein
MKINCSCAYCTNNTYVWSINDSVVWIEIPKNGSYNLKQFRFNFDSTKNELEQTSLLKKVNESEIKLFKRGFVILRNPIERFRSLLSHYFIKGGRFDNKMGPDWINSLGIADFNNDNICDIVLDNWQHIEQLAEPHHFNSQSSFIPDDFFDLYYMVYHMDELSLYFGLEADVNSSGSSDVVISDFNLERIKQLYADDFELYSKYFPNINNI